MADQKSFYILLVDDDSDDRLLFAEAAQDHPNIILEGIEDGSKLMSALKVKQTLPDVIFLDLNMPEKSGRECLSEIRKHDKLKDLPIIIFSTSSNKKDIDETFALGANLYITKPNSFTVLQNVVNKVLHIDWTEHRPGLHRNKFVFAA